MLNHEGHKSILSLRPRRDEQARVSRLEALHSLGHNVDHFSSIEIPAENLSNNIESLIGTTPYPTGLVGPIYFKSENKQEFVYAPAATSEGALIASMNRGISVMNLSGGFTAHVIHQKMMRAPAFHFRNMSEAIQFEAWLKNKFYELKDYVKKFSASAELCEIRTLVIGDMVECKFVYQTRDAAGQNMTSSCTWHACIKIESDFNSQSPFPVVDFILDCSGSSDKKISHYSISAGRGVHVTCEALIPKEILEKKLKTNAKDCVFWLSRGRHIAILDGTVGYNVNVANVIAALFLATGQDMACVHESSIGMLYAENRDGDLYCCLNLPRLVIGTVGGGTNLPHFNRALQLMDCAGSGKINRFAQLIAGITLGLEISTMAALVNGEFALAHERLGRNKPVRHLKNDEWLKGEVASEIVNSNSLRYVNSLSESNGIITQISKTSGKHLGLDVWEIAEQKKKILFKSKASDQEVLKSLYKMTGFIHPNLAKIFSKIQFETDFIQSHIREQKIYNELHTSKYPHTPTYFGHKEDAEREIYILAIEFLQKDTLDFINSECNPEQWSEGHVNQAFKAITLAQKILTNKQDQLKCVSEKSVESQIEFCRAIIRVLDGDPPKNWLPLKNLFQQAISFLEQNRNYQSPIPKVVVHNDFNPRNIAWCKNRGPLIYDWELSSLDLPTRDCIELLCFIIKNKNIHENIDDLLDIFKNEFEAQFSKQWSHDEWLFAYKYSLASFIVCRLSFYLAGNSLMGFPFMNDLLQNTFTMERHFRLS